MAQKILFQLLYEFHRYIIHYLPLLVYTWFDKFSQFELTLTLIKCWFAKQKLEFSVLTGCVCEDHYIFDIKGIGAE